MQVGRSAYTVWATRGDRLQRNYLRILSWCFLSGVCAVVGGLVDGPQRVLWWVAAVAIDSVGGVVGFWTPWLGRSGTREWTIDGPHFAERCQAFLLIALGESIVATGSTFAAPGNAHGATVLAFVLDFAGTVVLWWLYFDRSAEEGVGAISASDDPGRLARSAYHFVHPLMVGGVIATAAGDEELLTHPTRHAEGALLLTRQR